MLDSEKAFEDLGVYCCFLVSDYKNCHMVPLCLCRWLMSRPSLHLWIVISQIFHFLKCEITWSHVENPWKLVFLTVVFVLVLRKQNLCFLLTLSFMMHHVGWSKRWAQWTMGEKNKWPELQCSLNHSVFRYSYALVHMLPIKSHLILDEVLIIFFLNHSWLVGFSLAKSLVFVLLFAFRVIS